MTDQNTTSPVLLMESLELDGTHTGEVVLYEGFGEQARHGHMSDEYKDRYIIITLLKTPPRYYRQYKRHTVVPIEH